LFLTSLEASSHRIREQIRTAKATVRLESESWYPYDSLSIVPLLATLFAADEAGLAKQLQSEPVLDLGCADGDLSFLFESLASGVDSVDLAEANMNQMRGVRALAKHFGSRIGIHNLDLDSRFELPQKRYSLAIFLGLLYHLKNPFYVLEELARHAAYCVVSTRIAAETPDGRSTMEGQPLAYLLDERETNNDPTNFWIFSETALLRMLHRAGWRILATRRFGSEDAPSNPVDRNRDERIFVFLKSSVRFPELEVLAVEGLHLPEGDWCWTERRFTLRVWLPKSSEARQFALRIEVPEPMLAGGRVVVRCSWGGVQLGELVCRTPEVVELRGSFPAAAKPGSQLDLHFEVEHEAQLPASEARELGIVIPFEDDPQSGQRRRIPFRIS
jgi:tRNA (mo5U34)-methyltransferase